MVNYEIMGYHKWRKMRLKIPGMARQKCMLMTTLLAAIYVLLVINNNPSFYDENCDYDNGYPPGYANIDAINTEDKHNTTVDKQPKPLDQSEKTSTKGDDCPYTPPSDKRNNLGLIDAKRSMYHMYKVFDPGFGQAIIDFIQNGSVVEIGAGVGQLGYFLKQRNSTIEWYGFDKGYYIPELRGFKSPLKEDPHYVVQKVCWIDPSKPIKLDREFDWVISIETGENIATKDESVFLDNLVALSTKGVILTWATPIQQRNRLANARDNDYISGEMLKRNMMAIDKQTDIFRNSLTKAKHLKRSIMVFKKLIAQN